MKVAHMSVVERLDVSNVQIDVMNVYGGTITLKR